MTATHQDRNERRRLAAAQWAAAAQFAVGLTLSSSANNLVMLEAGEPEDDILKKTRDAVVTLQSILDGKHNQAIDESLSRRNVPRDSWWSALYKMVEGPLTCQSNSLLKGQALPMDTD